MAYEHRDRDRDHHPHHAHAMYQHQHGFEGRKQKSESKDILCARAMRLFLLLVYCSHRIAQTSQTGLAWGEVRFQERTIETLYPHEEVQGQTLCVRNVSALRHGDLNLLAPNQKCVI